MALQVYTFTQIVSNVATAIQASASAALNFTAGSVLRAISEAVAGVVLWLQAIVLQVLTLTRAATSVGADLDSWCADFGFDRLSARAATGQVTFSRFTATQQAVVPVGAAVQTADSTQRFFVTTDTSNSAYNAGLGGYVLPANTASVNVPVQAVIAGAAGNVQAGAISVLTSAIPGVDTVTNGAAFLTGLDAESDANFRARFVLYLASLSKATKAAIGSAVLGVQQGLNYTITENQNYNGTANQGYFYVVLDDGTGQASSDLLARVNAAIEEVRPFTSNFGGVRPGHRHCRRGHDCHLRPRIQPRDSGGQRRSGARQFPEQPHARRIGTLYANRERRIQRSGRIKRNRRHAQLWHRRPSRKSEAARRRRHHDD